MKKIIFNKNMSLFYFKTFVYKNPKIPKVYCRAITVIQQKCLPMFITNRLPSRLLIQ